ncbi:hypothetical protein ACFLYU_01475 [Candidatus Dependentiae bacterium]
MKKVLRSSGRLSRFLESRLLKSKLVKSRLVKSKFLKLCLSFSILFSSITPCLSQAGFGDNLKTFGNSLIAKIVFASKVVGKKVEDTTKSVFTGLSKCAKSVNNCVSENTKKIASSNFAHKSKKFLKKAWPIIPVLASVSFVAYLFNKLKRPASVSQKSKILLFLRKNAKKLFGDNKLLCGLIAAGIGLPILLLLWKLFFKKGNGDDKSGGAQGGTSKSKDVEKKETYQEANNDSNKKIEKESKKEVKNGSKSLLNGPQDAKKGKNKKTKDDDAKKLLVNKDKEGFFGRLRKKIFNKKTLKRISPIIPLVLAVPFVGILLRKSRPKKSKLSLFFNVFSKRKAKSSMSPALIFAAKKLFGGALSSMGTGLGISLVLFAAWKFYFEKKKNDLDDSIKKAKELKDDAKKVYDDAKKQADDKLKKTKEILDKAKKLKDETVKTVQDELDKRVKQTKDIVEDVKKEMDKRAMQGKEIVDKVKDIKDETVKTVKKEVDKRIKQFKKMKNKTAKQANKILDKTKKVLKEDMPKFLKEDLPKAIAQGVVNIPRYTGEFMMGKVKGLVFENNNPRVPICEEKEIIKRETVILVDKENKDKEEVKRDSAEQSKKAKKKEKKVFFEEDEDEPEVQDKQDEQEKKELKKELDEFMTKIDICEIDEYSKKQEKKLKAIEEKEKRLKRRVEERRQKRLQKRLRLRKKKENHNKKVKLPVNIKLENDTFFGNGSFEENQELKQEISQQIETIIVPKIIQKTEEDKNKESKKINLSNSFFHRRRTMSGGNNKKREEIIVIKEKKKKCKKIKKNKIKMD